MVYNVPCRLVYDLRKKIKTKTQREGKIKTEKKVENM